MKKRSKTFWKVLGVITFGVALGVGGYFLGTHNTPPKEEVPPPAYTDTEVKGFLQDLENYKAEIEQYKIDKANDKQTIDNLTQDNADKDQTIQDLTIDVDDMVQQIAELQESMLTSYDIDAENFEITNQKTYLTNVGTGTLISFEKQDTGLWYYSYSQKKLSQIYSEGYLWNYCAQKYKTGFLISSWYSKGLLYFDCDTETVSMITTEGSVWGQYSDNFAQNEYGCVIMKSGNAIFIDNDFQVTDIDLLVPDTTVKYSVVASSSKDFFFRGTASTQKNLLVFDCANLEERHFEINDYAFRVLCEQTNRVLLYTSSHNYVYDRNLNTCELLTDYDLAFNNSIEFDEGNIVFKSNDVNKVYFVEKDTLNFTKVETNAKLFDGKNYEIIKNNTGYIFYQKTGSSYVYRFNTSTKTLDTLCDNKSAYGTWKHLNIDSGFLISSASDDGLWYYDFETDTCSKAYSKHCEYDFIKYEAGVLAVPHSSRSSSSSYDIVFFDFETKQATKVGAFGVNYTIDHENQLILSSNLVYTFDPITKTMQLKTIVLPK